MKFSTIRSITVEDPTTWLEPLFVTIDVDWASDFVLETAIQQMEQADIPVTWFITHPTPLLERLRTNPKFELGLHPNFNPLLIPSDLPNFNFASAEEVLQTLFELVPEACSIRSHSMTQSSRLLDLFEKKGLFFDCNHYIPYKSGIKVKPWRHWNGMSKIPHIWEDDVYVLEGMKESVSDILSYRGLKVLGFHPIHLYLNTASIEIYEASRPYQKSEADLAEFISPQYGVSHFFQDVVQACYSLL